MVGIGPKFIIMLPILIVLSFTAIAALVLLVRLCIKKPLVGAIVVAVLLLTPIFLWFLAIPHRIVSYEQQAVPVVPSVIQSWDNTAAIWSPGIEDQFKADVYPSKISAVRALGPRISEQFRHIMGDSESPDTIVIFQNSQDIDLLEQLREVILKLYPNIKCRIEIGGASLQKSEVGIRFHFSDTHYAQSTSSSRVTLTSGTLQSTISNENRSTNISIDYVEKPWVDNFAEFLNSNPKSRFLVARSAESCLSEAEANQQAMHNACFQVGPLLTKIRNPIKLNPNDILENGLVVDRFVQSFDGTAGKIWRQALLIDASKENLNRLVRHKSRIAKARKFSFMRTFFSIAVLFILIIIVYAFLNAATKGYYTWSLRIAGFVLAVILIFLLL